MMVISAIMLLSMVILEFVYSTNINYKIAVNERERLQAFYLAESALNLMKVEIKIDKQLKYQIASSPIASAINNLPINLSEPMCQQFPFSTALIRGFFMGGALPVMPGSEVAGPAEGKEPEKDSSATAFESESAQEFLAFDGDFDGQCEDEGGKINFNYFYGVDPAQQALSGNNPYDSYKILIANFLKQERFSKLFTGITPEKIDESVRNVADWVDKNDVINELGNMTQGMEDSLYTNENDAKPVNAKLLSLDEIHLVDGIDDTWFMPVQDMFTVYGDNKVNVCIAEDEVVWTLILAYAAQNPNLPPLNQKDPELKKKLVDTVKFGCTGAQAQVNKIAADLDAALGIGSQSQGSTTGGFANFITTESRYFSLKLTGQVNETMVNIMTVLDIKNTDPKRWRMLYYKVY